ncbi:hypothetical protein Poli38472_002261 [Pythium oligandrum]|uniref:Sodium-dependent phosphate transporter n=1 Tax=Pythium oligandrum TaxID=41045 RepID=A0A8K1CIG4_PYTOL|nr:hypothetical protein Poli38472_002261 [Pythium oligandrum]|eukprot:TMW63320.1 hypothetical protein Poli38472_002261 [Pythium oligandrum]
MRKSQRRSTANESRVYTITEFVSTPASDPSFEQSKYALADYQDEVVEDEFQGQTSWRDVFSVILHVIFALCALYFFLVGIKLIGDGLTLALGCNTKDAFDFTDYPIQGLVIGTVATALIHSSSTVTSITVALVGTGAMTIRQAVPVVMGANIGTCITCILVAFAHVGDIERFERAMAAATVHDMYNIWSVIVMFPIEILFHPLEKLSIAMSDAKVSSGSFESPIDAIVDPFSELLLVVDKNGISDVATGKATCEAGHSFLIGGGFNKTSLRDGAAGGIVAAIGFVFLICALFTLVKMMAKVFLGTTRRVIARALEYNGYLNILIGTALTFAVHSSTLVTSTLTPLAGLGVITLEQVYPLAIGANLGTTATALLASLVAAKSNAVAIALVHLWFNIFGIFLFYPIPITRRPILSWARNTAAWSAAWPFSALIFVAMCFLIVPGVLLGLAYLLTASSTAATIVGWVFLTLILSVLVVFFFWYVRKGGRERWHGFLERKRLERQRHEEQEDAQDELVEPEREDQYHGQLV